MYLATTSREDISSMQLSKELGCTQKTAWFMLHRIRELRDTELSALNGIVEIDDTYIGGKEDDKHAHKRTPKTQGRSTKTKTTVLGMIEHNGNVKAMPLKNTYITTTHKAVKDNVAIGSQLYTDDARHWTKGVKGYKHQSVNHGTKEFVNGMAHTNGIEVFWAVLKRGYYGTYHQLSRNHLHRYVNEFSFRLNQGNYSIDTLDRLHAVVTNSTGKRLTYKELISE